MQRIAFLALTLAMSAVAAVPKGNAENYPSRSIRLIVGFPPGSAADITARLIGDFMSRTLGQQVVVEARPGAGSSIAAEFATRSPADGYTLFIASLTNVTNAVTSSNLQFDFIKDLAPVVPLTGLPLILAVHPSLGVSSVDALIALARSKPGELTYGSVGPGSVGHLAMELISVRTNIKLVHVPYPGSPPQVTDWSPAACRWPWRWLQRSCRMSKLAASRRSPRVRPSARALRRISRPSLRSCCPVSSAPSGSA